MSSNRSGLLRPSTYQLTSRRPQKEHWSDTVAHKPQKKYHYKRRASIYVARPDPICADCYANVQRETSHCWRDWWGANRALSWSLLPAAPQTEHPAGCSLLRLRNRLREVLELLWELCGCTETPQGSGTSLSRGAQSSPTSRNLCGVAACSQTNDFLQTYTQKVRKQPLRC